MNNNTPLTPVQIARIALVRLSEKGIPPTPESYRRFYNEVAGIVEQDGAADDSSHRALESAGEIVDSVAETTHSLLEALAGHNDGLKSSIHDLRTQRSPSPMLEAVNEILRTAVAMHQSVDASHGELRQMRDSLQDIRQELASQRANRDIDTLTGARSRLLLDDLMRHCHARARRYGSPLCVALFDIDHFRVINDQFGVSVGDRMLTHIGEITRSSLRDTDVFVRYGGEEFLVLMPETEAMGAQYVLDRLRLILQRTPLVYNGQRLFASFSAGVAHLETQDSPNDLIERAQAAMQAAKAAGRNQIVVAPRQHTLDV